MFYVLAVDIDGTAAYLSYALSAYSLVITVTGFTRIVQAIRGGIGTHPLVKKLKERPLGGRFLADASFRAEVSIYQGFFINLLYIIMKLASEIYYRSTWFITISVYYSLLALMRFFLLRHVNRNTIGNDMLTEWRRYRLCGIMLLLMN